MQTALFSVVQAGHPECSKILMGSCAEFYKGFVLSRAAQAGNADCLKVILEAGVDVN